MSNADKLKAAQEQARARKARTAPQEQHTLTISHRRGRSYVVEQEAVHGDLDGLLKAIRQQYDRLVQARVELIVEPPEDKHLGKMATER